MADSVTSFFTSLFPSSKPPPKPARLKSDTRTIGSTARTTTSVPGPSVGANSDGPGPTTSAATDASQQQIRDQRALFLDKLSSGPARGKWKGNNNNTKGGKPNVQQQSQPSS